MIDLTPTEILSVYILLRRHEKELDALMAATKNKIEESLFNLLTIDQMENLEQLYALHGKKLSELLNLEKKND